MKTHIAKLAQRIGLIHPTHPGDVSTNATEMRWAESSALARSFSSIATARIDTRSSGPAAPPTAENLRHREAQTVLPPRRRFRRS